MEFNVEGADARTGRSRIVRIEAENEQDAETKAAYKRLDDKLKKYGF